jgi:D-glycero-D-manno-heptose 1,7-bisphosphate phosphatase
MDAGESAGVNAGVSSARMVLVDRDGTIDRCSRGEYILEPEGLELLPNAGRGLRALQDAGLRLAVVTNQAAVGRGWIDDARLDAIHERMLALLEDHGVRSIEGVLVCPHRPEDGCGCRKPRTGLALRAADELGFDPDVAFVVGDRASDVAMGHGIGATTVLVRSGQADGDDFPQPPDHVTDDLLGAAAIITGLVRREEAP